MTKPRIVMGPEPHLAHCEGCGKTFPKPPLPAPVAAFVTYLRYIAESHPRCEATS